MLGVVGHVKQIREFQKLTTHQRGIALLKAFRQAEREWLQRVQICDHTNPDVFLENIKSHAPEIHFTSKPTLKVKRLKRFYKSIEGVAWRNVLTGKRHVFFESPYQGPLDFKHLVSHELLHLSQVDQPLILFFDQLLLARAFRKALQFYGQLAGSIPKLAKFSLQERNEYFSTLIKNLQQSPESRNAFLWSSLKEHHDYRNGLKHLHTITQPQAMGEMETFVKSQLEAYQKLRLHLKNSSRP